MSIKTEEIKRIARLACIKIQDFELKEVCGGLDSILDFVEQLKQVDCSRVDDSDRRIAGLPERGDVAVPCDPAVMDNAPKKECNMFVVPKVIG
ncbi:MAG: Asp-tRNA(Asn)/Glu-tRNA(Gln) amidotransferase subunit GatC [Holosporaceae bacterium]|nr:Asp-tRNA(Asn)/Glu-tRNA(Gln) amidotransferase subunit GatC [Holosporaceae bacterium]